MKYMSYKNIVKWWLTAILVFIPFQYEIVVFIRQWNGLVATTVSRLDEITIIVCSILAAREYYKNRDFPVCLHGFWIIPVFVFCVSGFVSGIVNSNSLLVTCHGIYDYVKYFAVIFIYGAFFREPGEFNKLFRAVLTAALFICAVAIIEELWALVSRYVLESRFADTVFYYKNAEAENRWRFGIYRAPSLMAHYNQLGLYMLLIFVIYMNRYEKINIISISLILAGIFLSMSRTIYAGLVFFMGMQIFLRKRKLRVLMLLVPLIIIVVSMSCLPDFNVWEYMTGDSGEYYTKEMIPYRVYAMGKAMEVWGDHPLLGTGPGMFGGGIADKYNSYVNSEYNVNLIMGGLDQFWPQVLAEMGMAGAVAYAGIIISIFIALFTFRRHAASGETRNILSGVIIYLIMLIIYSLGNRLDVIDPVLFTYLAVVGIVTGIAGRCNEI